MAATGDRQTSPRVLVAGATGHLGSLVVQELRERNIWVRALTRHRRDAAGLKANDIVACDIETGEGLATAFAGQVDIVFSALGNSVQMRPGSDKSSFWSVDFKLNKALMDRARNNGVRRFVYTSIFAGPGYADAAVVQAHESATEHLRETGMEFGILRPTTLFSSLQFLMDFAKRGWLPLCDQGDAFVNPISDQDVARIAVDMILSEKQAQDIATGGPQMVTRRELGESVFRALKKPSRFSCIDGSLVQSLLFSPLIGLVDRRLGELLDFYVKVSQSNSVAPPIGTQRMDDFLTALASDSAPFAVAERKPWGGQNWSPHFAPSKKR